MTRGIRKHFNENILLYMVYNNNNKTSHIIIQAIFGRAMPVIMCAFLLCQIRQKPQLNPKMESYLF